MIYTVSKKLLIIASIISWLFIFWCNKNLQSVETINTWDTLEQNIEDTTWNTISSTWTDQNYLSWATSWDIKVLIEEYKTKNTWDSDNLNENDIDLMEKVIDKIEKK
jgi:hypothetical protein